MTNFAGCKVLLVDDEPSLLEILTLSLRDEGIDALAAGGGMEAEALLAEHRFGAVITDIRMPEVNGIDLLARIQAIDMQIPVAFMTGFADLTRAEAHDLGAHAILYKPFSIADLLALIERLVRSPAERWSPTEPRKPTRAIVRNLSDLSEAAGAGLFCPGWGGAFIQGTETDLTRDGVFRFDVTFMKGEVRHLGGIGIIRWANDHGFGIEFDSLDDASQRPLADYLTKSGAKAFIPKQPRR